MNPWLWIDNNGHWVFLGIMVVLLATTAFTSETFQWFRRERITVYCDRCWCRIKFMQDTYVISPSLLDPRLDERACHDCYLDDRLERYGKASA